LRAARTVIVEREEPVSESVLLVEERRRTHSRTRSRASPSKT
jgi:hypothetical protein